jgi:plasmid maintenance system antidote protein VapI
MAINVIKPEDMVMYVTIKMGNRSVDQFAKDLGVPRQRIYEVLSGKKLPSKSLLKKLGLGVVYRILGDEEKR